MGKLRGDQGSLVMLHAAGSGPRSLAALAGRLGHGAAATIAPALAMTVVPGAAGSEALGAQVRQARAALGDTATRRPRLLFGHSFGGLIGLLALIAGAEADSAVLYEPIVIGALDPQDPGDRAARSWDRGHVDHLAERVAAGDPEPGVARFIEAWNEVRWPALPPSVRRAAIASAGDMTRLTRAVHDLPVDIEALGRLRTPLLILHGDRSPDVARRMARRLAGRLPTAVLAEVRGAGHMAPALAPDAVATAIRGWLERAD